MEILLIPNTPLGGLAAAGLRARPFEAEPEGVQHEDQSSPSSSFMIRWWRLNIITATLCLQTSSWWEASGHCQ